MSEDYLNHLLEGYGKAFPEMEVGPLVDQDIAVGDRVRVYLCDGRSRRSIRGQLIAILSQAPERRFILRDPSGNIRAFTRDPKLAFGQHQRIIARHPSP